MSFLYGSNFKYPNGEPSSGITRYRSAPSSFLESLVGGDADADANGCIGEDYCYPPSSSLEMDAMVARIMSPYSVSADSSNHDPREFGGRPVPAVKREMEESQMVYQSLPDHGLVNDSSVTSANNLVGIDAVVNSMALEIPMQETKMSTAKASNLVRLDSSPARFFSSVGVDNGFSMIRDVGSYRGCDGFRVEDNSHINFSSGQRVLAQIGDAEDESNGASCPDLNAGKRPHMHKLRNDAWNDPSLNGLKRLKSDDRSMCSGSKDNQVVHDHSVSQSSISKNRLTGLTHHLSLPKAAAGMVTTEKYLQFQASGPCKIRAKRGFATYPRSIAERIRRSRISERIRILQGLFPNIDKQANTADMLDLAVEHIKDLQKQVESLTDTKAKCTCSSKQKQ